MVLNPCPQPEARTEAAKTPAPLLRPLTPRRPAVADGSWRYRASPGGRFTFWLGAAFSVAFHVGVLFGFGHHQKPVKRAAPVELIEVKLMMPNLKDLEEPPPPDNTLADTPPDVSSPIPMLADVPSPNITDSSFVQPMDFRPEVEIDLSRAKVITIPNHISRGGSGGKGFGVIFDLSQLDRIPEATVQASPIFPVSLKKEVSEARVLVNFIVTPEGTVTNAYVEDSTHLGFNEAAVTGVSKWKFRPGMKGGRRVNTRMVVPIIFRLMEGD